MSDAFVSLEDVTLSYGQTVAVPNLDLNIREGELIALLGPSGCGKTTSMRDDPPPVVNSVPDAQPPPNCIPIPKTNAPSAEDRPIGITTGCMFRPVTSSYPIRR